jgi:hypothetical protein
MKKLYVQIALCGAFMFNSLFLNGSSDAELLWNEIGGKLAEGHCPSDELLADFNEKLKKDNEALINRPYGDERTVYGNSTLLFRATQIVLNTWDQKLSDGSFDTLSWVKMYLNRVVDILYGYGARLTEDEKNNLKEVYKIFDNEIKEMNNDVVLTEFKELAQLLNRIGVNT